MKKYHSKIKCQILRFFNVSLHFRRLNLYFTHTNDPADTGEVKKEISGGAQGVITIRLAPHVSQKAFRSSCKSFAFRTNREKVESSALRAAEIKKKTGWHRDEIAPADLLQNEFGGAFLYPIDFKKTAKKL